MNSFGAIVSNCKLLFLIGTGISADKGLLLLLCAGDLERLRLCVLRVVAADSLELQCDCWCFSAAANASSTCNRVRDYNCEMKQCTRPTFSEVALDRLLLRARNKAAVDSARALLV